MVDRYLVFFISPYNTGVFELCVPLFCPLLGIQAPAKVFFLPFAVQRVIAKKTTVFFCPAAIYGSALLGPGPYSEVLFTNRES